MDDKTSAPPVRRPGTTASLYEDANPATAAVEDEQRPPFFPTLAETSDEKPPLFSDDEALRDGLTVRKSNNGTGVFAARNFRADEIVIQFYGERLTREELLSSMKEGDGHYMQIGKDLYLGASGGIDDFFNHSCEPNAGVVIEKGRALLVAIKPIPRNTEVTFDYSTTMDDDWEKMECNCARNSCRKYIRDFKYLPDNVRKRYLRMGIVPEYISKNYPSVVVSL